jgi:hypothetical protein
MQNIGYKKIILVVVGLIALLGILGVVYYFGFVYQKNGTVVIKTNYPEAIYFIDDTKVKPSIESTDGVYFLSTDLSVGEHKLEVKDRLGTVFYTTNFKLRSWGKNQVDVNVTSELGKENLLEGE